MTDSKQRRFRSAGIWIAAVTSGALMMVSVLALLGWNIVPSLLPPHSHALLGATPLALAALSGLVYQAARRPTPTEILKAAILAAAFLFWALNQLLPDSARAQQFNDLAIALFALDVFLTVVCRPPALSRDESVPASSSNLPRVVAHRARVESQSETERTVPPREPLGGGR
jgi:hypothetical protein